MNWIISTGRMTFKQFQVRLEQVLLTRIGQIAIIVTDMFILVVPVLILIVQVNFHFMQTGLNPVEETISMYVWCEHGIAQSIVLFLQSVAMFALISRLYFVLWKTRSVKWGLFTCILIGIGMLIVAVCPTRANGAPLTVQTIAHIGSALTVCGLSPLALLLIANGFKTTRYWQPMHGFCIYTAVLATVVGLAGLVIILADLPGLGVVERILMFNSIVWVLVLGIKLLYRSSTNYRSCWRWTGSSRPNIR